MILRSTLVAAACIFGCSACVETGDPPEPQPDSETTEYRFVVEIGKEQDESDLAASARRAFDGPVEVEPLFPQVDSSDDPAGLSRIYVVSLQSTQSQLNVWDLSYRLRDAGDFPAVEPDMRDALADLTARSSAAQGCNDEGVPAPVDRAWALRAVKAPEAWALPPEPGGRRFGEGVRICHLDTGWTEHVDLDGDRLDLDNAWSALDKNGDAEDPLNYRGHPGHGAGTGSVIMSSGGVSETGTTGPGLVTGVAPKSALVPIRSMKNVVHFLDSDVARAVHRSTIAECDVISMSLGGRAFFGLERAIKDAVSRGTVVVAAAGNCVGLVVAPAMYTDTIAVAATNFESKPWKGSSRGSAVTVSAPGEDVYRAERHQPGDPTDVVEPGNGTSYATAIVAGAAALWIAHNGENAGPDGTRQARFREALRASAVAPADWDPARFGPGIVDLEALLLHESATPPAALAHAAQTPAEKYINLLAWQTDLSPADLRRGLGQLLGTADFNRTIDRVGPELLYLAATRPAAFRQSVNLAQAPSDLATISTAKRRLADHSSETLAGLLGN